MTWFMRPPFWGVKYIEYIDLVSLAPFLDPLGQLLTH